MEQCLMDILMNEKEVVRNLEAATLGLANANEYYIDAVDFFKGKCEKSEVVKSFKELRNEYAMQVHTYSAELESVRVELRDYLVEIFTEI